MNYWKLQRDFELSELEHRAPRTAAAVRALYAADEDCSAALVMGAAEPGRPREDIVERLQSAVSACWDESVMPDIFLLIEELT